MGDRVAVLSAGLLQQLAHAADALRPAGERVRRLLHGLAGDESVRRVDLGAGGAREGLGRLPGASAPGGLCRRKPALAGGDKRGIIVGIRPESLTAARRGPALSRDAASPSTSSSSKRSATSGSCTSRPTRRPSAARCPRAGGRRGSGVRLWRRGDQRHAGGKRRRSHRPSRSRRRGRTADVQGGRQALHFFDPATGAAIEECRRLTDKAARAGRAVWFVAGSQHLYGEDAIGQVDAHARRSPRRSTAPPRSPSGSSTSRW